MTLELQTDLEVQVLRAALHDWLCTQGRLPRGGMAEAVSAGRKLLRSIAVPEGKKMSVPRTRGDR